MDPAVGRALIPIPGFAEPFSSLSHLAGAVVFLVLSVLLVRRGRGDPARVASLALFGFGSVFLLAISGTYHLLSPGGSGRHVMQILDHAAIFVLIACSFTPPHVILFRGWGKWPMVALIWLIAVSAITFKAIYFGTMPDWLSLSLYLGMGWIGVVTGASIWQRFGFHFVEPILWGGVAYSIGAVLEFLHWPIIVPGVVEWHEVFHVAVLIGLAFHWAFAYTIADGRYTPAGPDALDAAAKQAPAA